MVCHTKQKVMSLKESNDGLTRSWGVVSSLLPFYDGGKVCFINISFVDHDCF